MSLKELNERKGVLIIYLKTKVASADWHAVSDAANDLQEVEVEIRLATDDQ